MTVAGDLRRREYADHVCPPKLERDGSDRPGWHGGRETDGVITNICVVPTFCGCKVVGSGTIAHPVMIEPCGDHKEDMYG